MHKYLILGLLALFCLSCNSSKKIVYLQDATLFGKAEVNSDYVIKLQPQDAVTIVVSSKDPKMAALFNLPRVSYRAGNTQLATYDSQISQYTIDSKGLIDFPVLGSVKIAGLKREEVAELIKEKLIKDDLLLDPVVTVDYVNLNYSVIGEVNRPGKYKIDRDQLNIFEAISTASDLTITGKRDNILVTRETDGIRTIYEIDLRSEKIFDSPAFYVQQGDIIYVQPNNMRANQSTLNGNTSGNITTWLSLASVLSTLGFYLFIYK